MSFRSIVDPKQWYPARCGMVSIVASTDGKPAMLVIEAWPHYRDTRSNAWIEMYEWLGESIDGTPIIRHSIEKSVKEYVADFSKRPSYSFLVSVKEAEGIVAAIENNEGHCQLWDDVTPPPDYLSSPPILPPIVPPAENQLDEDYLNHRNDTYLSFYDLIKEQYMAQYVYIPIIKPTHSPWLQLKDMFYPFKNAWQSFMNLRTLHTCREEQKREVLQPLYGLLDIILGIGGMVWGAISFIYAFLKWICFDRNGSALINLAYPFSWIVEGASNVVCGALKVILTPLTYMKWPLRFLLSGQLPDEVRKGLDLRRIEATGAILQRLRREASQLSHCLSGEVDENLKKIRKDCTLVWSLLTEMSQGSHKNDYHSLLPSPYYRHGYRSDNGCSSILFAQTAGTTNFRPSKYLINAAIQNAKDPGLPEDNVQPCLFRDDRPTKINPQRWMAQWMKLNQAINACVLPSEQDIQAAERYLDRLKFRTQLRR